MASAETCGSYGFRGAGIRDNQDEEIYRAELNQYGDVLIYLHRDITTYEEIIKKLLKDAYRRLERFLRKKCHKKVLKLTTPTEEKYLL